MGLEITQFFTRVSCNKLLPMLNNGSLQNRCYGSSLSALQKSFPVPFERVKVVRRHWALSLDSKSFRSGSCIW